MNTQRYNELIQKLKEIRLDIEYSEHDSLSYEDHEPSQEEIESWLERLDLAAPKKSRKWEVLELPEEYWSIFDTENKDLVMSSVEYQELFDLYSTTYQELYEAATEESAYYQNESDVYDSYLNSMRGSI